MARFSGSRAPGARRRRPGAPGFTMRELVVAVGVIGTVLLGIAGVFIVSYTNVDHGGRVSRATTYGHQKLEELRNISFGVLATVTTASDVPEPAFTRTWTVTLVPGGAPPARVAVGRGGGGVLNPTGAAGADPSQR